MSFFQHIRQDKKDLKQISITHPGKGKAPKSKLSLESSFIKEIAPVSPPIARSNFADSSIQGSPSSSPSLRSSAGITPSSDKIDVDVSGASGGNGTPNIIFIDEQIKKSLNAKYNILPELQNYLSRLLWIVENSTDAVDVKQAGVEIVATRKRIQDIETGSEYSLYILRTADLLEEYKTLFEATRSISFIKTFSSRDETKIHRRNKLLLDYLRTAKEYINLDNYKQKITKPVCESCHSINLTPTGEGDSMLVCECGATLEQLDDAPTFKDSERVNMSSRYTYTCRGHFIEAMNRFEGKQNTEIDEEVVKMLKKEVGLHRLTSDTATKDHIYMFMTEKKLSDYYADINLIYFKITAKNPPDITEYRNELLEMHDQLEEAYMEVKEDERLNSLNVNWKLYKLLQLLGYECKKDDFFCLKTPTKQGEHEQKWHDMIEYLKSKYPNAVTSYGAKRWRHVRTL
jgi:hypothetical protein